MFNEYSCYNWESNKDIFIDEELGKAILNNSQTKYLNIGHITQISTSVAKTPSSKQMKLLSQHLLLWKAFDVVIPFKPNAVFFSHNLRPSPTKAKENLCLYPEKENHWLLSYPGI